MVTPFVSAGVERMFVFKYNITGSEIQSMRGMSKVSKDVKKKEGFL